MLRTAIFVVGRIVTALLAALFAAVDFSGASAGNVAPDTARILAVVAGVVFVLITLWREIELFLAPKPVIQFTGFSPVTTNVLIKNVRPTDREVVGISKIGHFLRVRFTNDARDPSGGSSVAQHLAATVEVINTTDEIVDRWMGRWANSNEPQSEQEIYQANRIDLPPNGQEAILDIGVRYNNETEFYGWDNTRMTGSEVRIPIPPGQYRIRVTLRGSNLKKKIVWFRFDNPHESNCGTSLTLLPAKPAKRSR